MTFVLVRTAPDLPNFAQWAAQKRFLSGRGDDLGYALHASLKEALGDFAPRPFYLRETPDRRVELLGYVASSAQDFLDAVQIASGSTNLQQALGLHNAEIREMPGNWREGRALSFECRVRPIVRQITGVKTIGVKGYPRHREVDAAAAAWSAAERKGVPEAGRPTKNQAYGQWLEARFMRGGARLSSFRIVAERRTFVLRRPNPAGRRQADSIEGPDVLFRGELSITDSMAFATLLKNGVGRHCGFGFGMLLVAPSGALA